MPECLQHECTPERLSAELRRWLGDPSAFAAIEAEFLLEEGATPEQVDAALKDCGMAMGRFAVADLAGLDIGWTIRKRMAETRKPGTRSSRILERVCALGRFGQKTGAGFYRYEAGSRTPLPDPVVHGLVDECSRAAGMGLERPTRCDEAGPRTRSAERPRHRR